MKITVDKENRISVTDISAEEKKMLKHIIRRHIDLMPKVYRKRNCNWIIVKNLLNNGYGVSVAICKELDNEPFSNKWVE